MFVYVPRHLSSIEIVSQMTQLLKEYVSTYGSGNNKSFDYYYYYYTIDPVKNFIRMCSAFKLSGEDEELDEGILNYLIRLFYSVKGTPKVLEFMESELGLPFIPDASGNKYVYTDNKISYTLEDVDSFNLNSFMEAQEKFLGALLYYEDLVAFIEEARLHIEDNLESNITIINWNYTKYEI